jgi:hypothetical protein
MRQKLPESFSLTSTDSTFPLPAPDERIGAALIKVGDGDAFARQPL